MQMCLTCGLEPGRPGFVSKCMCMCGLGKPNGGCSLALHGNGDEEGKCRNCGGGRTEIASIGTVEVKAKRPRWTYVPHVLRGEAFDNDVAAAAVMAPAVMAAAAVVVVEVAAVAAASVDGRCFH